MKPKRTFKKSLEMINNNAKSYGYKTIKEQAIFSAGYMSGFSDGVFGKLPGGNAKKLKGGGMAG